MFEEAGNNTACVVLVAYVYDTGGDQIELLKFLDVESFEWDIHNK